MIRTEELQKTYGDVVALGGLDLSASQGSILALLGPNGAGKTTAVRILSTLLKPDRGLAEVAGIDVTKDPVGVRRRIGLSGQSAAVDEYLSGYENLEMVGRLYRLGAPHARQRARELLTLFQLDDAADRPVKGYSGGMRRRLDLAAALVAEPPVLFLDEPTTGLDPASRNDLWDVIRDLVRGGTTLLLTTQYLEEADRLADQIAVIDQGRVIANGTADQLKAQLGGERVVVVLHDRDLIDRAHAALRPVAIGEIAVDQDARTLTAPVSGGTATLMSALRSLDAANIDVQDAALRRPTLDDVFLTLTGHMSSDAAFDVDVPQTEGVSGE